MVEHTVIPPVTLREATTLSHRAFAARVYHRAIYILRHSDATYTTRALMEAIAAAELQEDGAAFKQVGVLLLNPRSIPGLSDRLFAMSRKGPGEPGRGPFAGKVIHPRIWSGNFAAAALTANAPVPDERECKPRAGGTSVRCPACDRLLVVGLRSA